MNPQGNNSSSGQDSNNNTDIQNISTSGSSQNSLPEINIKSIDTLSGESINHTTDNSSIPSSGTLNNNDLLANDSDLIEKEWVEKAKEIINKTEGDPYIQTKKLNELKSVYLKKRYNKDLKYDN